MQEINTLLFNKNEEHKKILNIYLQKDITTYLNYSMPLCAILWDKGKILWMYEHFNNIYCINDRDNYLWLDFVEDHNYPQDAAEYISVDLKSMEEIEDIIDFIKGFISDGYYVRLILDEYYLSEKPAFGKEHNLIQVLIFGYNDTEKRMKAIGFLKDNVFGIYEQSYQETIDSYNACRDLYSDEVIWHKLYNAILIKVKDVNKKYRFNSSKLIDGIQKYISSCGDASVLRPEIRHQMGDNAVFGIQVYDEVIIHLNNLLEGNFTMDYRFIHLLSEHKKLLNKKLIYFDEHHCGSDRLKGLISQYAHICSSFEWVRSLYLKNVLADNDFKTIYGQLKNKEVLVKIIESIKDIQDKEKIILSGIYNNMTYVMPRH